MERFIILKQIEHHGLLNSSRSRQETQKTCFWYCGYILIYTLLKKDVVRTFSWDKRLENLVKENVFLGGKDTTIVSPSLYKDRFRIAIEKYFLMVYSITLKKVTRLGPWKMLRPLRTSKTKYSPSVKYNLSTLASSTLSELETFSKYCANEVR